jgi:hypothetical protein
MEGNRPVPMPPGRLIAPPKPPMSQPPPKRSDQTLPELFNYNFDDYLTEKKWRSPKEDITDYFNYGLNEETWKIYVDRVKKLSQQPERFKQETSECNYLYDKLPLEYGGFGNPHFQAIRGIPFFEIIKRNKEHIYLQNPMDLADRARENDFLGKVFHSGFGEETVRPVQTVYSNYVKDMIKLKQRGGDGYYNSHAGMFPGSRVMIHPQNPNTFHENNYPNYNPNALSKFATGHDVMQRAGIMALNQYGPLFPFAMLRNNMVSKSENYRKQSMNSADSNKKSQANKPSRKRSSKERNRRSPSKSRRRSRRERSRDKKKERKRRESSSEGRKHKKEKKEKKKKSKKSDAIKEESDERKGSKSPDDQRGDDEGERNGVHGESRSKDRNQEAEPVMLAKRKDAPVIKLKEKKEGGGILQRIQPRPKGEREGNEQGAWTGKYINKYMNK